MPSSRDLRQISLVFDCPLDGLDRVLEGDEDFAHPLRLAPLVCLRQYTRNVATLLYLTVSGCDQLSNVLVFLSHGWRSNDARLRPTTAAESGANSS